jgi:hypothetical protein
MPRRGAGVTDPVLIDENRLDQECVDQPRRVRDCGREVADLDYEYARAKAKFELREAELKLLALNSPSDFDGAIPLEGKPTVATIEAAVTAHKDYQAMQRAMHQRKHEADVAKAELEALRQRRPMLECAVQLHLTNYHSEPRFTADPAARTRFREKRREAAEAPAADRKKGRRE